MVGGIGRARHPISVIATQRRLQRHGGTRGRIEQVDAAACVAAHEEGRGLLVVMSYLTTTVGGWAKKRRK
jgi:hypothetical protein